MHGLTFLIVPTIHGARHMRTRQCRMINCVGKVFERCLPKDTREKLLLSCQGRERRVIRHKLRKAGSIIISVPSVGMDCGAMTIGKPQGGGEEDGEVTQRANVKTM